MRWPFSLPRRSKEPTPASSLTSGEPGPTDLPTGEQPGWAGAGLEPLPRTLGSAPLTVRSSQFIAGLAVSHGLTPTLRPLEHEAASNGPVGVIGGLAMPAAARAWAPTGQTGGRGDQAGGGGRHTELAATVRGSSDSAASSLVDASDSGAAKELPSGFGADVGLGFRRRLPVVDPAAAERGRSYSTVDPASDPSWSSGRMQLAGAGTGAGPGRDAAANPMAVPDHAGWPTETLDSVGSAAASRASIGAEAGPGGGLSSAEGQSHLSPGRVRRTGLGAPLAGLPGSAQPHGLASSQQLRAAVLEGTWGSGTAVGAGTAAAERMGRRSPITGGVAQPLPVLAVAPFSLAGSSAGQDRSVSAGRENQTMSFASAGPARGLPGGARPGAADPGTPAPGAGSGARSISVQRAAIGRSTAPNVPARSPAAGASSAGAGQGQARPVWSPSSGSVGPGQPRPAGAELSALPLAGPPSPPASSLGSTGAAEVAPGHVIQRIHAPELAQLDALGGGGHVVVARAAATDGSSGASQGAAAGAAAGVQSIPEDQVEQLAGRVYWRIRDRLGAELLRDRERAGLLRDR